MNDSNDPRCMVEPTRSAVLAWLAAGGGRFHPVSVCRSTATQARLRISNGCPDVDRSPASSCRVPTAIPGTSKHERGLAIDIGGDKVLARELAPRFGLGLTVSGEDWHFEVVDPAVAATHGDGTTGTATAGNDPALGVSVGGIGVSVSDPLSAARQVGELLTAIADPDLWRRIGMGALGVLLALAGAALVLNGALPPSLKNLAGLAL